MDVWLANLRGTPNGMRHTSLKPSQKRFWDFRYCFIASFTLLTYCTCYGFSIPDNAFPFIPVLCCCYPVFSCFFFRSSPYCYDGLTDRRIVQWKQNTVNGEITNYSCYHFLFVLFKVWRRINVHLYKFLSVVAISLFLFSWNTQTLMDS